MDRHLKFALARLAVFVAVLPASRTVLAQCAAAYPPVTAPGEITASALFTITGGSIHASSFAELQTLVNGAEDGTRIIIDASYTGSVVIAGKRLFIEGAAGAGITALGSPHGYVICQCGWHPEDVYAGFPAFVLRDGAQVQFANLVIRGGDGLDLRVSQPGNGFSGQGGYGAEAVEMTGATAAFKNCIVRGGDGGRGEDGHFSPGGPGGNGGSALVRTNATVLADATTSFQGGSGGQPAYDYIPPDTPTPVPTATVTPAATPNPCARYGTPASPLDPASIQWSRIDVIDAIGRQTGDFDGSGFTDLADFLFLLDHWQNADVFPALDLPDFLAMLDNWQG